MGVAASLSSVAWAASRSYKVLWRRSRPLRPLGSTPGMCLGRLHSIKYVASSSDMPVLGYVQVRPIANTRWPSTRSGMLLRTQYGRSPISPTCARPYIHTAYIQHTWLADCVDGLSEGPSTAWQPRLVALPRPHVLTGTSFAENHATICSLLSARLVGARKSLGFPSVRTGLTKTASIPSWAFSPSSNSPVSCSWCCLFCHPMPMSRG
jgi:hypothetical protein